MNKKLFLRRKDTGFLIEKNVLVILLTIGLLSCNTQNQKSFILSSAQKSASVYVLPGEPEYVHLAVKDLCSDVKKITGNNLSLITNLEHAGDYCLVVGSVDKIRKENHFSFANNLDDLEGKWESYKIKNYLVNRHYLLICGSDSRGTMFGVYDFIETCLGVDPMYFWNDRDPKPQKQLVLSDVDVFQNEPSFKYRGWFINDEDLLTEWYAGEGRRDIDYPFYTQVVHPEVMEHVVEALVRLRMNLIIPASFIDIRNPPEAELVKVAAKRGVFVSMHHVEPMGVSAFTFFNYWKNKTGEKPLFSYFSNREKLEEVWQVYAKEWANYPNVIWQIGLRGIADRPMWTADPNAPETAEERGRLISEAMEAQMKIIHDVDKRPNPPVTTTLWMEGSALNKEGHLKIPENITVVFSDNCPGWKWQDDFYLTDRKKPYTYGVYYHHQLWGSGPHLAQGTPVKQTYNVFKETISRNTTEYAILNVSNIREFVLPVAASARMLYHFDSYDPAAYMKSWTSERFGKHSDEVERLYNDYFNGFVLHDKQKVPMLLDGQIRSFASAWLNKIKRQFADPVKFRQDEQKARQQLLSSDNNMLAISDAHPKPRNREELIRKVIQQKDAHFSTLQKAKMLYPDFAREEKKLFENNFLSHLLIMVGLEDYLISVLHAQQYFEEGNTEKCISYLEQALKAFDGIRSGLNMNVAGEKWQHWYRGEKKMNLSEVEKNIQAIIQQISKH